MSETEQIDFSRIPNHVAIIMDGNGRWAKQHGEDRSYGHQVGVESVRVISEEAAKLGIKHLTLYTFSTENWNRPKEEITALMDLLMRSIEDEVLIKNNIKLRIIGDLSKLPAEVRERVLSCASNTESNTGMCLVLAISYSSRWEITEAVREIAGLVSKNQLLPDAISEELMSSHLSTHFMPDPDLLIRTGGESRLSNYLLWQCAYSELYFCDTYWPAFRKEEFFKAILDFQQRERRFGKTSEQVS